MIKMITEKVSNTRFAAYILAMTILALTAPAWIPSSSALAPYSPLLKVGLLAIPLFLFLVGAHYRWPKDQVLIQAAPLLIYGAMVSHTITSLFR